jgi:hypothetical protein
MTTWTIVDDDREGVVTHISDAARQRLADEQRMNRVTGVHTSILIGSGAGLVIAFGGLVISKLLGA